MKIFPIGLKSGRPLILLVSHLLECLDKPWGKYQAHNSVMQAQIIGIVLLVILDLFKLYF